MGHNREAIPKTGFKPCWRRCGGSPLGRGEVHWFARPVWEYSHPAGRQQLPGHQQAEAEEHGNAEDPVA